uniref:Uncharacterized protein n=1 Tax=Anguilla anguilla TaxID=7936 RepID=A0A0E9XUM5_ANGAN
MYYVKIPCISIIIYFITYLFQYILYIISIFHF